MQYRIAATLMLTALLCVPVSAQNPVYSPSTLAVKEITVFKDGNAFVLREGKVHVGADHAAHLADLPNPVLGTFWPYSASKTMPLKATIAGRETVKRERDAMTPTEFLRANIGSKVQIERTLNDSKSISGTVLSVVTSASAGADGTIENGSSSIVYTGGFGSPLVNPGVPVVILQTDAGILPLPTNQINTVLLPNGSKTRFDDTYEQNVMTLQFDGEATGDDAEVGMMYLQRGLRWIPQYKVALDGKGTASIDLQATLINDLTDFSDTSLNLVIGVPSFAFKDTPDPIGMQDVFARLSRYFSSDSPTANNLSNAIMTQSRMGERVSPDGGTPLPEFSSAERNEDLFLFSVKHVSLKRGQRMALPVTRFSIPYRDVYTLEIPPGPPQAIANVTDPNLDPQLARLLSGPRVRHQARLKNTSSYPLTTAPALLLRGDRVLAQSMMTYTAIGGQSDLPITNAVEVSAQQQDTETKRVPNAIRINGDLLSEVTVKGTITLTNFRKEATDLEVTRYVVGDASDVDHNGSQVTLDPSSEPPDIAEYRSRYVDYARFNKLTKISWKLSLAPGQTVTLNCQWTYRMR